MLAPFGVGGLRFGIHASRMELSSSSIIRALPTTAKSLIRSLLSSPLGKPLRSRHSGLGSILLYHRVVDEISGVSAFPSSGLSVHWKRFDEQMGYISRNFRCIDLGTAVRELREGTIKEKSVIVTFDDGYRDNMSLALPILERHKIPATIFVTTGLIDGTAPLWWFEIDFILKHTPFLTLSWRHLDFNYELSNWEQRSAALTELNSVMKTLSLKDQGELLELLRTKASERFSYSGEMLSWEEIALIAKHPLITIGAHTVNHPVMSRTAESDLQWELTDSRRELEKAVGKKIEFFAYPFGARDQADTRDFDAVKAAGYLAALTTRVGHLQFAHQEHLFALPRIPVDYFDSLDQFKWKLSGLFAMINSGFTPLVVR